MHEITQSDSKNQNGERGPPNAIVTCKWRHNVLLKLKITIEVVVRS